MQAKEKGNGREGGKWCVRALCDGHQRTWNTTAWNTRSTMALAWPGKAQSEIRPKAAARPISDQRRCRGPCIRPLSPPALPCLALSKSTESAESESPKDQWSLQPIHPPPSPPPPFPAHSNPRRPKWWSPQGRSPVMPPPPMCPMSYPVSYPVGICNLSLWSHPNRSWNRALDFFVESRSWRHTIVGDYTFLLYYSY